MPSARARAGSVALLVRAAEGGDLGLPFPQGCASRTLRVTIQGLVENAPAEGTAVLAPVTRTFDARVVALVGRPAEIPMRYFRFALDPRLDP